MSLLYRPLAWQLSRDVPEEEGFLSHKTAVFSGHDKMIVHYKYMDALTRTDPLMHQNSCPLNRAGLVQHSTINVCEKYI